jgi:hypothetical protein
MRKKTDMLQAAGYRLQAIGWLIFGLWPVACSLWLSSCGYTTRSMISNKYKTIYVAPFVNKIDITREADTANKYKVYKALLETDITKSVVDKFLFDGNLKPVKQPNADLLLKGEVTEFRRDPLRYDDDNNVEEYRINILVNLKLIDAKSEQALWQENGFTSDSSYFVRGTNAKPDDTAVSEAISDLSRRIVERTVEQW